eukprot:TRINITY_DN91563_c0_g1_i1.p1 TRINITY_DN91563_c0_g1~~TRINITY_DN91563_c0_g1_i1.p1  ORF type:complete len:120 (+),score=23.53 TRINITY_DN91563_c0_g1_i1:41-400(+)
MGVEIEVIQPGDGKTFPKQNDQLYIEYKGYLEDGTVFDSSYDRGKPITFLIGIGSVIKGWDEGVMKMSLNEKAKLTISPDYAYGDEPPTDKIPPNATLIFDVHLVQINDQKPKGGCIIQ